MNNELKPPIEYNDFAKLDVRVGTIREVKEVENSEKLLKLKVDFGDPVGERIIFSGIKKWYSPEDLAGMQTVFLVNLEPRKMPGGESQGMLLAADGADGKPALFSLGSDAPNGAQIL